MAVIHLDGMQVVGNGVATVPGKLAARLAEFGCPNRRVKGLVLNVGKDEVHIWPADPTRIRELGTKLLALADEAEPVSPSVEARA